MADPFLIAPHRLNPAEVLFCRLGPPLFRANLDTGVRPCRRLHHFNHTFLVYRTFNALLAYVTETAGVGQKSRELLHKA